MLTEPSLALRRRSTALRLKSPVVQRLVSVGPYGSRDGAPYVSALAEELAQLTCRHLPRTDQRVITLELGVGECDLAIHDMVRGAVHSACPVPGHITAQLHEWLDGYDATACTDQAQLRGYVNRLRCA